MDIANIGVFLLNSNSSLGLLGRTRVAIAQISEYSDECEHGGDRHDGEIEEAREPRRARAAGSRD